MKKSAELKHDKLCRSYRLHKRHQNDVLNKTVNDTSMRNQIGDSQNVPEGTRETQYPRMISPRLRQKSDPRAKRTSLIHEVDGGMAITLRL
ncbi:unnamed protein product [Colias eurytheme]|nr:unnamed protein product [Colias eurytheme]